jgi:hypothetical protein
MLEGTRPPDEDVAGATTNNSGESTSTLSTLTLDTGGNSDTRDCTTMGGVTCGVVVLVR